MDEASGACQTRLEGNDDGLKALGVGNATAVGAGHVFVIALKDGYPINILGPIKQVREVCSIFCATASPVEVIVAQTAQGRGVLGVVDGFPPKAVETEPDVRSRYELLRKIGYKR